MIRPLAEPLQELGVDPALIDDDQRAKLDRDGFLQLPGVLDATHIEIINARIAELLEEEGERAAADGVGQEPGTDRLCNLVDKGPMFDIAYTHPLVLTGIAHVLDGDVKLSSLNSRTALPGAGMQGLHADWLTPRAPDQFFVCNSIWLLDDFTENNGPTRLIPGSHREQPTGPEVKLVAHAGTVVIFNSHVLHGGTHNSTDRPRRAMHGYFTRRAQPQQTDQRSSLSPATVPRLSPPQRWILDV